MPDRDEIPPEIRSAFAPPDPITVSQWAERNRVLLGQSSSEPGPWRNARTPYLAGVMDAFSDPRIEKIVLCKGSQVGGTEALYNMLGYAIEQDPAPALLVMPTVDLARSVSANRLRPMIEACEVLRARMPANPDDFTLLEMRFPGMVLVLCGANSPASLASRPCRYVFLDEVDKFPPWSGQEADPISLAMERQKTFWNKKTVVVSTPTVRRGHVTRELETCDAVFDFHVPCPSCGAMQVLTFQRIMWPETLDRKDPDYPTKVRDAAVYHCAACGRPIPDTHRQAMLQAGQWRPRTPPHGPPRSVGFHLPSFYSPWLRWGDIAEAFVRAKDFPEKLQNVVNSWFAEPWEELGSRMESDRILELRDGRPRGVVPSGAVALTAGVDVQQHGFYYVIRAWRRDMASGLVREGFVETFEDLEAVLFHSEYRAAGEGEPLRHIVRLACIDSGFRTDEVYEWARRNRGRARAIKGATHPLQAPFIPSKIDYSPGGKLLRGGLTLWLLDTGYWKDALFRRMQMNPEDPGAWTVHGEVTRDYADQLVSEEKALVRNRKNGRTREEWRKVSEHARNHFLDCECYALAAAEMLGVRHVPGEGCEPAAWRPVVARSRWMTREAAP